MPSFFQQIQWWPEFGFGLALCLLGWTLYWAALNITGGALGAALAGGVAFFVTTLMGLTSREQGVVVLVAALLGFIIGLFLIRKLHGLFFYLLGFCVGLVVMWHAFPPLLNHSQDWIAQRGYNVDPLWGRLLSSLAVAVVGGFVLLFGSRWVVMALSSMAGAALIVLAVPEPLFLIAFPFIALFAFAFQLGILKILGGKNRKTGD